MRLIKLALFLLFPVVAFADTDPECLNHLGGAFAGVECYNGLAVALQEENDSLAKQILKKIPRTSGDALLLRTYIRSVNNNKKFCDLQKNSYADWKIERPSINPRYYDYDVVYFECIYDQKLEQNRFFKKILENLSH